MSENISHSSVVVMSLAEAVENMIKAGCHRSVGMTAAEYQKLWPETVVVPAEYVGRFSHLLLVDTTIKLSDLAVCAKFTRTRPENKKQSRPKPVPDFFARCYHMNHLPRSPAGKSLTRYIAFVQLGDGSVAQSGADLHEVDQFDPDEVGLTSFEGAFALIQYRKILKTRGRNFALPGTLIGPDQMCMMHVDRGIDEYPARSQPVLSRGVQVIAVTEQKNVKTLCLPGADLYRLASVVAGHRNDPGSERLRLALSNWFKGYGHHAGYAYFEKYLAAIPEIPSHLCRDDNGLLVLVDPRLDPRLFGQCAMSIALWDTGYFTSGLPVPDQGKKPVWIKMFVNILPVNQTVQEFVGRLTEGSVATASLCLFLAEQYKLSTFGKSEASLDQAALSPDSLKYQGHGFPMFCREDSVGPDRHVITYIK